MAEEVRVKVGLWCINRYDEDGPHEKQCSCQELYVDYGTTKDNCEPFEVCEIVTLEMTDEDHVLAIDVRTALNMSQEEFRKEYRRAFFPELGYQLPPTARK
ncbi:hypothetical protein SAMN04487777_1327 [Priestia aryabhattai B8W22]|uniref:hypothetical protein n=1 Tax=Priestia aryabhattai TaxID=412384 RepID=UPI000888DF1B|nr:hypothetical protein SAMN04487777_1327 [Priestia aryabhattai B8W22]